MRVIILNGPPKVGKDTFAVMINEGIDLKAKVLKQYSIKWVLCVEVGKRYGLDPKQVWDINADPLLKDKPNKLFGGKSVRQALIYESEDVIKVKYGEQGVARLTYENLLDEIEDGACDFDNLVLMNADGGFNSETKAMQSFFGIERSDMFIVRIDKPGHTFAGFKDSREYLENPDLCINNDSTLDQLRSYVSHIQAFLDQ